MLIELEQRISHCQWRCIVKKERRRRIRQARARERDKIRKDEQEALLSDPAYLEELEEYQRLDEIAQRFEEEEAARRKEEWQLRDAALHSKFVREKEKCRLQEEARLKQEALIKKEWEEKQKKEKEEEEKKNDEQVWIVEQGKKALLDAATQGLGKDGDEPTQNPEPPANYTPRAFERAEREPCPFFTKTGACRFGIHCSREHDYPEISDTVLIPNMYSHFGMEKVAYDEYDDDACLEYSEMETLDHFRDFYEDTLPEFKKYGSVMQLKVCCNASVHLRGNVYVQYSNEAEATQARIVFHGRWYAGRQLNCIFVTIAKWRAALCRLFQRNRKGCPKGGQCNFLHAYRNPGNAFWRADQDLPPHGPLQQSQRTPERGKRRNSSKGLGRSQRSRSRSKSRSIRSSARRSRSRSIERNSHRSRSSGSSYKSKSKSRNVNASSHRLRSPRNGSKDRSRKARRRNRSSDKFKRSRRKSRSPKRSRSKSRSPKRSRTKSRSPKRSRSKSRSPKRSRSKSRSPKRSRSKSRSPKRSRSKSRSPKRLRSKSRSPKRSRSKSRSPKRSRSKSRSPKRSRSKSRSPKRLRSKSRSPKRSRNKSRSLDRSKKSMRTRSRSPSRSKKLNGSQSNEGSKII